MKIQSIMQTALTLISVAVAPIATNAQSQREAQSHRSPTPNPMLAPQRGPNGGSLKQAGGLQLETVVWQGGIKLFVFDRNGQPLSVEQGRGAASLSVEGKAKRYRYDLLPDGKGALMAPVNLSQLAGRQIEVDMQFVGLPGTERRPLMFSEVATVPASEQQLAAAAIARQKICPVSRKPLGSMGQPVAVDVNEQTVYVCCKGCINKVQAEPAKYLAMVDSNEAGQNTIAASGEQIRPNVFKVTSAEAPFVAAQKSCPVMDEPLDAMGGPYRVNANGKAIYICCPGCAKKIAADPQKYLSVLAQQGIDAPVIR